MNEQKVDIKEIEAVLNKYRCSDHHCIFGHPGGMGTNGGCNTRKLNAHELRIVLQEFISDIRALISDKPK